MPIAIKAALLGICVIALVVVTLKFIVPRPCFTLADGESSVRFHDSSGRHIRNSNFAVRVWWAAAFHCSRSDRHLLAALADINA